MSANGQPAPLVKCECSACRCENATPKPDLDIDAVCHQCNINQHRTQRVITLEQELMKAQQMILKLEDMKGIEWKN